MNLQQFSDKKLRQAKKALEHAKANRPGGLLISEQFALDNINNELSRRR